jgi:ferredoxin
VNVIHIDTHRGADRKLVLDRFDIEAGGCVFCGFCVEACPFEALTMMHGFELAAYNREQLLWDKEMLAIKSTPRTLADMERIHGPGKEEKKEAAAAPSAVKPVAAAVGAAGAATAPEGNGTEASTANGATAPNGGAQPAAPTEAPMPAEGQPARVAAPASDTTEPSSHVSEAVPGATGGERSVAIQEGPTPPPANVSMPLEGTGVKPEPGAPPGPADSPSQASGPKPPSPPT